MALGKSIEWLEDNLSNREWSIWADYFSYMPQGQTRDDLRFAVLYQMLLAYGGSKMELKDLMLENLLHPQPLSQDDLESRIKLAMGPVKYGKHGIGHSNKRSR